MADVEVTRDGAVQTITLNRPEKMNAFTRGLHAALRDALKEARDPEVRAVVVTGAGRAFCAGQDLTEFSDVGDISAALRRIAAANAPFISRGDKSGTHSAELRAWKEAGVEAKGSGYRECGCGMGPALNIASSGGAYTLTDRGTWLSFKNRGDLVVLVEGDKRLFNQYGVMIVSPQKHPHVKAAEAQKFVDWVISPEGQSTIASYRIDGQQLFFPDAER